MVVTLPGISSSRERFNVQAQVNHGTSRPLRVGEVASFRQAVLKTARPASMRAPVPALVVLAGMGLQSTGGLLLNPYRDIEWITLGWPGNDAVALFRICPLRTL